MRHRNRVGVELRAVIRKEVRQTVRDRRVMFLLVAAPLLQTIALGYAADFNFENVPTVVVDRDPSTASRDFTRGLFADGKLRLVSRLDQVQDAMVRLSTSTEAAAVVLPMNLQRDLLAARPTEIQVIMDGTDPNRGVVVTSTASQYASVVAQRMVDSRSAAQGLPPFPKIRQRPRILYNPGLDSAPFMIPGVMSMLLVITTTIVTAMGLSREKEMGTLEQILVTPIRPSLLLLGKMTPFFVIGCFDVFLVLTVGVWIFGVPLRGDPLLLVSATVLYLFCTLGLGLLISSISKTQQQSFLAGFLVITPAILLSGVMTPITAMPHWLRVLTYANPVRYYIEILRANLLKGAGFADMGFGLAALGALAVIFVVAAGMRFKKTTA